MVLEKRNFIDVALEEIERRLKKSQLTKLNCLDLSYCFLEQVPDLSEYDWVTCLELQGNNISGIDKRCLPQKLTSINLNNNDLENIYGFDFPESLSELFVRSNDVKLFDEDGFDNLEYLDVYGNKIAHIKLPLKIRGANISDNFIENLIDLPDGLDDLNAAYNMLSALLIPENIESIDLSHNKFKDAPHLPASLTTIILSHNELTKIDYMDDTIEIFIADNNEIDYFINLSKNLRVFNVAYNKLNNLSFVNTDFPDSLKILNLRNNPFDDIENLPLGLEMIDVRGTTILSFNGPLSNNGTTIIKVGEYDDSSSDDDLKLDNFYSAPHEQYMRNHSFHNRGNNGNHGNFNRHGFHNYSHMNYGNYKFTPSIDFSRGKVAKETNPDFIILRRKLVF